MGFGTLSLKGRALRLLAQREPVYARADMVLDSGAEAPAVLLDKIVAALAAHGLCDSHE